MKTNWKEGAFLYLDESSSDIFIPEDKNEDHDMIIHMVDEFVKANREKSNLLENQVDLMKIAGSLGLLNAHILEEYGGMDLDTNANTFIAERIGKMGGSFNTTFAAHIGIGMLPIYYFGTEAQKQKYLVPLGVGEKIVSYCLTEPNAGSDALSGKTYANLSDDGEYYVLNGQKMWISNAGFADVFVVFAKIDKELFTGFIVDAHSPGVTLGEEEKKMGIKGSSTRQVFFENVQVPIENILGEIGKGHKIAFNVLNIGRYKLGAMSIGGCKGVLSIATEYAKERFQFKVPIASFGAIQSKLAEMTARIFANDSVVFRVSNWMGDQKQALIDNGESKEHASLGSAMAYALECAVIKVIGSETLEYLVDENVQIHGGMGYSEEGVTARLYRDARINRIYEGTNEINRLIIVKQLLKGAEKGENLLVIQSLAWLQGKEATECPSENTKGQHVIWSMKEGFQYVLSQCMEAQMNGSMDLRKDQQVAMALADMVIDVLVAESTYLRVQKLIGSGIYPDELIAAIQKITLFHSNRNLQLNGQDIISHISSSDDIFKAKSAIFDKLSYSYRTSLFSNRKLIAKFTIENNGYPLY